MTPLKPIEDLAVKGVEFGPRTYPISEICAHPDCAEPVGGKHHCFPRSQLKGDYWYVEINGLIVAHVVGLCGSGTTGHHGQVESHDAWIKLEDGEFVWYDRQDGVNGPPFTKVGPLNPQPGSGISKPKRKRLQGEERRKRRTISIRVPDDTENGGEVWDELIALTKEKLVKDEYEDAEDLAIYETVVAGLYGYIRS